MVHRIMSLTLGLTALVLAAAITAQEPGRPAPTQPGGKGDFNRDDLAAKERLLKQKYDKFEQALLELKQRLERSSREEDQKRAVLLGKVIDTSIDKSISTKFDNLVRFLSTMRDSKIGEVNRALEDSARLAADLKLILELLRGDHGASAKREEAERIKALIKEIEGIIRDQKIVIAQNETGSLDKKDVLQNQKNVTDATREVGKKLDGGKEGKPGQGQPKDDKGLAKSSKGGEGKEGESKDGGQKGKEGEGKEGESKDAGKGGEKSGEAKDGKEGGKGGEGKEGQAKEGKGGEGKEGQAKEGKGGEGKEGQAKEGKEGKEGSGQAKEGGKPGDPKQGAAKEGSKGGEKGSPKGGSKAGGEKKDAGNAKGGTGKPGEKSAESKEGGKGGGESKPGEAKEGSKGGGQAKGSGQPGQPGEQSQAKGDGQKSPPPPPGGDQDSGPQDARKKVKDAEEYQGKSEQKIVEDKKREAVEEEEKAVQELEKAKKKLEDLLRQLREEELERLLEALKSRCEKMLAMQLRVLDGTIAVARAIDANADKKAKRENAQDSLQLSDEEKKIVYEATKAIEMLEQEGSAVAFPEVFHQVREDMKNVERRLGVVDVGKVTQAVEQDICDTLKEMIKALEKAQQEMKDKKSPPSKPGPQGPPPDQKLLDKIAELKMIRSMQLRVNSRTELYGKQYEGEQAQEQRIRAELRQLAERQERIFDVTNKMAKGDN